MLQRLVLRDYRNFVEAQLEFAPRFTILHGHNGAGKTNALEAIYLVSTLRSFRTSDLGALVRTQCEAASVELRASDPDAGLPTTLEVRLAKGANSTRRTAIADGKTVRTGAAFYGRVPAILFTPEDLAILRGSPSGRRQFVDRMIFARDQAHIGDVQRYEKLVRSRNQVLRREDQTATQKRDLLETYEADIAATGARLWTRRVRIIEELAQPFAELFARIHGASGPSPEAGSGSMVASVRYAARLGDIPEQEREQALAAGLLQRRGDDLKRGTTTVGPHRDDLDVSLAGEPAANFASQGQARALVLAFKLAELQAARDSAGVPPILLLDDVSSELDPPRTRLLFAALGESAGQCVLTTTSPRYIDLPQGCGALRFRVDRGQISADPETPENGV